MSRTLILRAFREAVVTMAAALATMSCALLILDRAYRLHRRQRQPGTPGADTLVALGHALDPAQRECNAEAFVAAPDKLEGVAPAFRALRLLTQRWRATQPADWLDELAACKAPALTPIERSATPAQARRAVAAARKAMREPRELRQALQDLNASLR